MTQMYQNEKSPILNGQEKSKTSEKVQKNEGFRGTYLIPPFWEHPVYASKITIQIQDVVFLLLLIVTDVPM